jgi:hypothetical protein
MSKLVRCDACGRESEVEPAEDFWLHLDCRVKTLAMPRDGWWFCSWGCTNDYAARRVSGAEAVSEAVRPQPHPGDWVRNTATDDYTNQLSRI